MSAHTNILQPRNKNALLYYYELLSIELPTKSVEIIISSNKRWLKEQNNKSFLI